LRLPNENNDIMSIVYYIGDKRLTLDEFRLEYMTLPGYIETVLNFSENEMTVMFVNSTISKKGLGTLLLCIAMITAGEEGIEQIILDDDSDNYRKPNNIKI
jgi:hypothetical protein